MIDLKPEFLTMVQGILDQYLSSDMQVWAYGSRVNDQAHSGSDLDLVVINLHNPAKVQENLFDLREAFCESNLPILVDVMDWARIPVSFQKEIEQNYRIIWPKPNLQ